MGFYRENDRKLCFTLYATTIGFDLNHLTYSVTPCCGNILSPLLAPLPIQLIVVILFIYRWKRRRMDKIVDRRTVPPPHTISDHRINQKGEKEMRYEQIVWFWFFSLRVWLVHKIPEIVAMWSESVRFCVCCWLVQG